MDYDHIYDYTEALKRQKRKQSEVDELRKVVSKIPHIPKTITDKQLLLFIDACEGVEEGAKVCNLYYETRRKNKEHFKNRDPEDPKIQQCMGHQDYFYLPNTPTGDVVIFHRLSSSRASDYVFDEAIKTFFMTIDMCLRENGPRDGAIFLFDMKGVGLMHLLRINLSSIRKFFHYVQECVPGKLRAIHVMNTVSFMDKILALIKPFVKADILNNLHLHPSSVDMEKFYKECIPRSSLPSDFGGDCESVEVLHKRHCEMMIKNRNYFLAEEKQANGFYDTSDKSKIVEDEIMRENERSLKAISID